MSCHGGVKQQGGLSFLFKEAPFSPAESGKIPIIAGNAAKSEIIKRIKSKEEDIRMPPEGEPLNEKEIEILSKWINQGAEWETHWAYLPIDSNIQIPPISKAKDVQPIDQFILRRLEKEGLVLSERAEKATLLRRLYFDLIGLPPNHEETKRFLADNSENAYEKTIDLLLASPHFGEKWAAMWLDLARYADSKGYQKDKIRPHIWRYRDWVIDAFNQDLPFDQFTIEQLAGDLLPNPTDNQILATAFHRNTMTNDEGGTDDEEFRVAAVLDRLNTTFEVWQGTTMSCVQCHSHPYDPILQEEFYNLYAFLNNTADNDNGRDTPLRILYSPAQKRTKENLSQQLDGFKSKGDTVSAAYKKALENYLKIKPGLVQIMRELPDSNKRVSKVFERGNWLAHGKTVAPATPKFLPAAPDNYPANRMGLAKWLVDGNNPLTARVFVNRIWEQIFGNGLVTTIEDFGTQGQAPSHPELLDWLANEFVNNHQWRLKQLLKQIVLSKTYQQSSKISPQLLELDPYNYLLARGARFRLSAEAIRDQALVVSGLFNPKVYGPSVKPHQPEGVWNVIRHVDRWHKDSTGNQYRRGIYTFWRRVSPYPSMITFDVPSREVCVSRRIRTNTPLQALVTLNDPVYVEASEALAKRMMEEGGIQLKDQIAYGYQLVLMKNPDELSLNELLNFYQSTIQKYQQKEEASPTFINYKVSDNAAYQAMINVANVLLNLDEVIMKG
jgi:hypothetical protein